MKIIFTIFFSFCSVLIFSQTPAHPFPQHVSYTAGTIKPSKYSQSRLDIQVENYYDAWKQKYLLSSCGSGTYFVLDNDIGGGTNKNDDCVSEGQGYGMLIVPLMAGYDVDAKTIFDGLYKFFTQHKSDIDNRLMCWVETKDCRSDSSQGADAATDGDMNIAYGLLLADKQWGSSGAINYKQEALKILDGLKASESNNSIYTLKLGDWVGNSAKYVNSTRTSDFMYDELRVYAQAAGDNYWTNVMNECYSVVSSFDNNESAASGLQPDFAVNCNTTPAPAPANFLEGKDDGHYSYNACRTPWHLATDYLLFGDSRAKNALTKINDFMLASTNGNVNRMHSGYKLDGTPLTGSNYQDECFLAPFTLAATESSKYQSWLDACYDALISKHVSANRGYYNNTLKLLNMITIAGDYWSPLQASSSVSISQTKQAKEILFPNPNQGDFIFHYPSTCAASLQLSILNENGIAVYQSKKNIAAGNNTLAFHLQKPAAGLYTLMIEKDLLKEKISFVIN